MRISSKNMKNSKINKIEVINENIIEANHSKGLKERIQEEFSDIKVI